MPQTPQTISAQPDSPIRPCVMGSGGFAVAPEDKLRSGAANSRSRTTMHCT